MHTNLFIYNYLQHFKLARQFAEVGSICYSFLTSEVMTYGSKSEKDSVYNTFGNDYERNAFFKSTPLRRTVAQ